MARRQIDVGREHLIIQCKHSPEGVIGEPIVRELVGTWQAHREATRAVLVTSGRFSSGALELAKNHRIDLVDGLYLEGLVVYRSFCKMAQPLRGSGRSGVSFRQEASQPKETHHDLPASDFTLPAELLEQIAEQGFEALPELIRIVINEAMHMERQNHLGVAPYQRSPERRGHGNGFKDQSGTRLGEITFAIPQVREGGFFPQALEKGLAQRTGADAGAGRDVRSRRLHSQSDAPSSSSCAALGLLHPGQPGRRSAG